MAQSRFWGKSGTVFAVFIMILFGNLKAQEQNLCLQDAILVPNTIVTEMSPMIEDVVVGVDQVDMNSGNITIYIKRMKTNLGSLFETANEDILQPSLRSPTYTYYLLNGTYELDSAYGQCASRGYNLYEPRGDKNDIKILTYYKEKNITALPTLISSQGEVLMNNQNQYVMNMKTYDETKAKDINTYHSYIKLVNKTHFDVFPTNSSQENERTHILCQIRSSAMGCQIHKPYYKEAVRELYKATEEAIPHLSKEMEFQTESSMNYNHIINIYPSARMVGLREKTYRFSSIDIWRQPVGYNEIKNLTQEMIDIKNWTLSYKTIHTGEPETLKKELGLRGGEEIDPTFDLHITKVLLIK